MVGDTAIDSTLFTIVGQPKRPISAGNGGFSLGFPENFLLLKTSIYERLMSK